jgi:undecaprenyl-diphosphatase
MINELIFNKSFLIGLWKCLAFIPVTNRSMVTYISGYQCGFYRSEVAEYSFLLGFVTLYAATLYEFVKCLGVIFSYFKAKTFLLGIVIACVSSMMRIKLLISFITGNRMIYFG